ncbi:MAG: UDP-N-acetylmuramate dehydrogenase [Phycisphaeraceae bacterium]|nr:UDP-N-acetylmuramate dehydrogenase [Phycisphaeraceae bacterium]
MATAVGQLPIEHNVPIPTWFRIGGRADRLARPRSIDELRSCLEIDPDLRILGDGANLLVDDDGIDRLVVRLDHADWKSMEFDSRSGVVRAGAGADFAKVITGAVRKGLAGLEGLTGIPATIGGATVMNAGGRFGEIASCIARVHGIDHAGRSRTFERADIPYTYRSCGLNGIVVTAVEFHLTPDDPAAVRARLKDCMAYKRDSQPMGANSAGCCFKNPVLPRDIPDIGAAGTRISAGLLIDRAGCKGLSVGGATVSPRHANFFTTSSDAKARHVIDLMSLVQHRVADAFGIMLDREVVVWSRSP